MARPKKDVDLVRPHRITFRMTDVEYEIIKKRCEGAGVSMSEYMRKALLGGRLTITHEIVASFPDIRDEMKRISLVKQNCNAFYQNCLYIRRISPKMSHCFATIRVWDYPNKQN